MKKLVRTLFLCVVIFALFSVAAIAAEAKARDNLDANGKVVYDTIKANLTNVIKNGGSTSCKIDLSKLQNPGQFGITSKELGESPIGADGKATNKAVRALAGKVSKALNWPKIAFALEMDCPYELTWWTRGDNEADWRAFGYTPVKSGNAFSIRCDYFCVAFSVADKYQDSNNTVKSSEPAKFTISKTAVKQFKAAADEAKKIVDANAGKSDREKLEAYKNEIRKRVKYDDEDKYSRDLVSVFDGDLNTNVACFGYSRAFQYLCNLSVFSSDRVQSRIAVVRMNGEGHACNVVTLTDGKNYLVDVTNDLFLKPASVGSAKHGYQVAGRSYTYWGGYYGFTHILNDPVKLDKPWISTVSLWKESQVTLASDKNFIAIVDGTPGKDTTCQAVNLFNDNSVQVWKVNFTDKAFLEWKMPSKIIAKALVMATASNASKNPGRNPASWILEGRNSTQESWKKVALVNNSTFMKDVDSRAYAFSLNNSTAYQYYRLEITKTQGSAELCISKIELSTK